MGQHQEYKFLHACRHVCMCACLHACIPTCLRPPMLARIHARARMQSVKARYLSAILLRFSCIDGYSYQLHSHDGAGKVFFVPNFAVPPLFGRVKLTWGTSMSRLINSNWLMVVWVSPPMTRPDPDCWRVFLFGKAIDVPGLMISLQQYPRAPKKLVIFFLMFIMPWCCPMEERSRKV